MRQLVLTLQQFSVRWEPNETNRKPAGSAGYLWRTGDRSILPSPGSLCFLRRQNVCSGVTFGSSASWQRCPVYPQRRTSSGDNGRSKSAIFGLMRRSKRHLHSITLVGLSKQW